jgi:hypothetical protein
MREKFDVFIRTALLVMSIFAIGGPALLGAGMMLVSLVFCDSGPLPKCAEMGAMRMAGYGLCAVLPIPVVLTLSRNKNPLSWYMYFYPWLMLALACVVYAKDIVALGIRRVAYEYGCLALVAFAHLVLQRMNAKHRLSAG